MALGQYVYVWQALVPSQTPIYSPTAQQPQFGDIWVDSVEVKIPSGHRGLTGFNIQNSGGILIPSPAGVGNSSYITGDDDLLEFELGVEVDQLLSIGLYNSDGLNHTFYFRFRGMPMNLYQANQAPTAVSIVPVA